MAKELTKTEFKDILKTIEKEVKETFDLQTHSVFVTYLENELEKRGYDLSDAKLRKQLDNWAMNNTDFLSARGFRGLLYEDLKIIDNEEGVGFIGLAEGLDENMNVIANIPDTPTNVVDDIKKIGTLAEKEDKVLELLDQLKEKYGKFLDDTASEAGDGSGLHFDLSGNNVISGDEIYIEALYIKPEHQNKGIGKEIVDELKKLSNEINVPITLIDFSKEGVEGVSFWEQLGFYDAAGTGEGDGTIYRPDTPTGLSQGPGAAAIDEIAFQNTQLIDNLPIEQVVKDRWKNLVTKRYRNLVTPGGLLDAVDVWEFGVMGLMMLAIAYKEYDEIPKIFSRTATNMFNNMTAPYNIPPVPLEQYDLDYEFMNKVLETGEKVMPTDILIKKVGDVVKGVGETGTVTGFGYVPTTPEKTDTMETTQKIQPGVQEEKMFKKKRPKKSAGGGSGVKIL